MKKRRPKFIFVVGGVMSGVGKGIATASIGRILESRGLNVTVLKIDPYVNVDAGTMNPTEHGEVFVLNDGTECDQDMGNYERFLDKDLTAANYMTTGSVYLSVIQKERNMEYHGRQVEVVPRIPLEVLERIDQALSRAHADIAITEIGGTVGEYENILFLEAVRMLRIKHPDDVLLILVSYVPALGAGGNELKTKPTQHAVRSLNSVGLHPDIILARAHVPLDQKRKEKIEFMCSLEKGDVVSAPNVTSIYEVPLNFDNDGLSDRMLKKLGIGSTKKDMKTWRAFVQTIRAPKSPVRIGIVGKYFGSGDFELTDSYISVIEAVKHAAYALKAEPVIEWLDSEEFEKSTARLKKLSDYHGVIIPGGFGSRGVEGKIAAIRYVREKNIPYFGLCYGMQLAAIEFGRHVLGLKKAHTTEVDAKTPDPIITINEIQRENLVQKRYGGSMRLGAYSCSLAPGTMSRAAYEKSVISERHRHRYEFNNAYRDRLKASGLVIAGINRENDLVEIIELQKKQHPFFVGVQFHPEFTSRPLAPHPLFRAFIAAAQTQKPSLNPA